MRGERPMRAACQKFPYVSAIVEFALPARGVLGDSGGAPPCGSSAALLKAPLIDTRKWGHLGPAHRKFNRTLTFVNFTFVHTTYINLYIQHIHFISHITSYHISHMQQIIHLTYISTSASSSCSSPSSGTSDGRDLSLIISAP
jgi:hypothetical protein